MPPEIIVCRQKAIEDARLVVDKQLGIVASAGGRFERVFYGRDSAESIIMANEGDQGALTPFVIESSVASLRTAVRYEGVKSHPYSGEKPGKKAHEAQVDGFHQDRLREMWEGNKELPRNKRWPVLKRPDGVLVMINYFADDATPKFTIAVSTTEATIRRNTGDSNMFLDEMWPSTKRGLMHDMREIDRHGRGVIVSEARGPLVNQTWMDSGDAYMNEEGVIPKSPYVFLSVNAAAYRSFIEGSRLANLVGETDLSNKLHVRADALKEQIDRLFWSEEEKYFYPLIDGDGRQVKIITSDAADAMWMEAIKQERAGFVILRLSMPDLMTDWGIRTRSSLSRVFDVNGYQRGTVWEKQNSQAAIGADKYGFHGFSRELDSRNRNLTAVIGHHELTGVELDGRTLRSYTEKDHPVSNNPQAWSAWGEVARTAANLDMPEPVRVAALALV